MESTRAAKKLLVVANMSAGKSTLINALIGYRLNKVKTTVCTSRICRIYNKTHKEGGIIYYNGTTYSYSPWIESVSSDSFTCAAIHFNSLLSNSNICVIDTPGYNNVDNPDHRKTTENIIRSNNYDGILYVANAQYMGTSDEAELLEFIKRNSQTPVVFAINQLDRMKPSEDSIDDMLNDFKKHLKSLKFLNPTVVPVSAKAALFFKLGNTLLDEDDSVDYDIFKRKFSKDYYDFQLLSNNEKSNSILEATGINQLETIIKNILKS